jgi:arsenite methyltransferase
MGPISCVFEQFLGETLRPGGLEITSKVAATAGIRQNHRVLDIGCGKGTTVIYLANQYHCWVTGIDLSDEMISFCRRKTEARKLAERVSFIIGDGEHLPFSDSSFDVVISECSFSLFPDKKDAAENMRRVLKSGGKLLLADIILRGKIDKKLQSQITFPCCLAGASPIEECIELFEQTGFQTRSLEDHSEKLEELMYQLGMAFGAMDDFLGYLSPGPCRQKGRKISFPSLEAFQEFIRLSRPGYALMVMTRI